MTQLLLEYHPRENLGIKDYETGLSRDERFILNKINHDYLIYLEKKMEENNQ